MLVGFVILHDPCPKIFPQNAINPKPHGLRLVLVPHITWARSLWGVCAKKEYVLLVQVCQMMSSLKHINSIIS